VGARSYVWGMVLAFGLAIPQTTHSQDTLQVQSPVLLIDSDQLYVNSRFGQRILEEVEAENATIIAENQRIATELEAEEKALTEQRPTLEPDAFRILADEFDEKVQAIRREQEVKARLIVRKQDEARRDFLTTAAPILEQMMIEAGATVVLERRQGLLFRNSVDITREATLRINAEIGDGEQLQSSPNNE